MAEEREQALLRLLGVLAERGYRFVVPTPATHAGRLARIGGYCATGAEEALGWNLPFVPGTLDPAIEAALRAAGAVEEVAAGLKSRVRVASLGGRLYLHSAFPTEDRDAVFFGPDSYRFADLLHAEVGARPPPDGARVADIGTGAGVGAIVLAGLCPGAEVFGTDVNPAALRLAAVNRDAAGAAVTLVECAGVDGIAGALDLIAINPPYIIDTGRRTYRDGGGMGGAALSLQLAEAGLARLAPGGRMILYTGSTIVGGRDALRDELAALAARAGAALRYREIDPDVFGEELKRDCYADADRIAVVAAILARAPVG